MYAHFLNNVVRNISYLFLSLLSGYLEIGIFVFANSQNYVIQQWIGMGIAYQLGNVIKIDTKNIGRYVLLLVCTLLQLFLESYLSILVAIFILSSLTQSARTSTVGDTTTYLKRVFRIIGFLLAIWFNFWIIIIFLFLFYIFSKPKPVNLLPRSIMLFHQLHYFTYCYVLIYILLTSHYQIIAIIVYVLGWVTYINSNIILNRFYDERVIVICHFILAIILYAMSLSDGFLFVILWIITGILGGSVYAIKNIYKSEKLEKYMEQDENIGHVIGVIIAIVIVLLFESSSVFIISSLFCLLVAVASVIYFKRRKI